MMLTCFDKCHVGKPLTEFAIRKTFWILWTGFNINKCKKYGFISKLYKLLHEPNNKPPYATERDYNSEKHGEYNNPMLVNLSSEKIIHEKGKLFLSVMEPMFECQLTALNDFCNGKRDRLCMRLNKCREVKREIVNPRAGMLKKIVRKIGDINGDGDGNGNGGTFKITADSLPDNVVVLELIESERGRQYWNHKLKNRMMNNENVKIYNGARNGNQDQDKMDKKDQDLKDDHDDGTNDNGYKKEKEKERDVRIDGEYKLVGKEYDDLSYKIYRTLDEYTKELKKNCIKQKNNNDDDDDDGNNDNDNINVNENGDIEIIEYIREPDTLTLGFCNKAHSREECISGLWEAIRETDIRMFQELIKHSQNSDILTQLFRQCGGMRGINLKLKNYEKQIEIENQEREIERERERQFELELELELELEESEIQREKETENENENECENDENNDVNQFNQIEQKKSQDIRVILKSAK